MGVKISELQEKTSTNDTDVLPIVDAMGGTKKITVPNLLKKLTESISNIGGKVTNLTTYSTEEVKTGETWIDGKPIYRKVFTGSGAGNIDITSLKIDEIFFDLSKTKFFWSNIGRHVPLPLVATASGDSLITGTYQAGIYTNSSKTKLTIEKGGRIEMSKYVITIEYTKTTD